MTRILNSLCCNGGVLSLCASIVTIGLWFCGWQGTDDKLVPPAMNDYAKRVLPHIHYHKLEGEGHFSWFCYCDSCHKNLFEILFGEVDHVITSSEPKSYIPPETATTSPLEAEKITTKG